MKQITLLLGALSLFAIASLLSPVYAAGCQTLFGGGQTCQTQSTISIDKTVQVPGGTMFVQNLSAHDKTFAPNQTVVFHLKVSNTSSQTIPTINIKDQLPSYLSYVSGTGTYNASTNSVTFTATNLAKNSSKTYTLTTKVASSDKLPANSPICVTNEAQAMTNDGQKAQDSTNFCLTNQISQTTKGGLPIVESQPGQKTPPTGPEDLALLGLIPTGYLGILLRKRS